jgi:uncharacterized LabA/DUF88 family protein
MGAAWFVDGGYANKAWQRVAGEDRLDYSRFRAEVEKDAGEKVGDAYYFNCDNDPPSAAQNGFHRYLRSASPRGPGLRVKLYWLQSKQMYWPMAIGGGPVSHPQTGEPYIQKTQKAVDVGLAFHLMRSYSKVGWNKLYLVAGDGDFHEVIQHLVENENVSVVVVGNADSLSGELAPYVDLVEFDGIRDDVKRLNSAPEVHGFGVGETESEIE